METSPSPFFPTTAPAYAPTTVFSPPPFGFEAPAYGHHIFPSAATYPPPLSTGGYSTSPFPFFYSAPPTFPYPPPASAYTPASGFYPNQPIWPPPAPDPIPLTTTSTTYANSSTTSHVPSVAQLLEVHDPNDAYSSSSDRAADACRRRSVIGVGFGSSASQLELPSTENPVLAEIEPVITSPPAQQTTSPAYVFCETAASSPATTGSTLLASAPAQTEEAVRHNLAGEIVQIQKRLRQQEHSLQSIQGQIANLSKEVAQIGISLGMHIQDGTSQCQASCFGTHRDVQVSEVPIYDVNGEETKGYSSENEIPRPPPPIFATASDQVKFQTSERMPESDDCSHAFVHVFESNPEQQPYEEEQQETAQFLTCISKATGTEESSACLNMVTDVLDVTLELQQQDDEKISVYLQQLRAPPSHVLVILEQREVWDPGASAFLVVSPSNGGTNDTIDNEHVGQLVSITGDFSLHDKTDLWSQSEHQFIVLQGVFEEVMLDIPPAKPPDSKQLSAIQAIQGNCLILEAMPSLQRGAFSLGNFATSALWRPTTHAGDKISWGLNTAANSQNVLPCISVSDTEHICLYVKLSPWTILSAQHFIDSSMKKGSIFSAECTLPWNPWYAILLLHHCLWELPISGTQRVQWDPGAKVSLYCWLDVLTAWSENDKPLSCTDSLAALQTQSVGNTASYVWNPGTMLLWYMSKGSLLFTEEKEMGGLIPKQWSLWFNTMHYCQIFQKCNALCCQQYSHQDIKLCGIPLWLINFRVP